MTGRAPSVFTPWSKQKFNTFIGKDPYVDTQVMIFLFLSNGELQFLRDSVENGAKIHPGSSSCSGLFVKLWTGF